MKGSGLLFVVAAPSGTGKTSLCKALLERLQREGEDGLEWSRSYTTRAPREGEVHGQDYFFVDEPTFESMVAAGEFAEWAMVHGRRYGTGRKYLEQSSREGVDLLLEIDIQGAAQLKARYKKAIFIFLLPPSWEALEGRLRGRATEPEPEVIKRLDRAREEMLEWTWFDYIIINDDFEAAVAGLRAIVQASRLKREVMEPSVLAISGTRVKKKSRRGRKGEKK